MASHNLDNKKLQYKYCRISQEVKTNKLGMKFGHLVEYNMRNIFIEKSCTKCAKETIPRPLPKNQN